MFINESLSIVKISVSSQVIYRFHIIIINPSKIAWVDFDKLFLELHGNGKGLEEPKEILKNTT